MRAMTLTLVIVAVAPNAGARALVSLRFVGFRMLLPQRSLMVDANIKAEI